MARVNYTTINHNARKMMRLSLLEYCFLDLVYHLQSSPKSRFPGWCYAKRKLMADILDVTTRQILRLINDLSEKGFLDQGKTIHLRVTEAWYKMAIGSDDNSEKSDKMSDSKNSVNRTKCPVRSDKMSDSIGQNVRSLTIDIKKDIYNDNPQFAPLGHTLGQTTHQTNYQQVVDHLMASYRAKFGVGYPFNGRCGKAVGRMVALYGPESVMALWDEFLDRDWNWYDKSNKLVRVARDIAVFETKLTWLLEDGKYKARIQIPKAEVKPAMVGMQETVGAVLNRLGSRE